jgi:tRNA threonylcarbamoyladenosine biosynthesis protein TsaE
MLRDVIATVRTGAASETERLGAAIGERLGPGACVCLTGPLGAGKTVIASGLCRGLGVREAVASPTFVLLERFEGRVPVVHVDLYRLEHEREIEAVGVFEWVGGDAVVIVEWGDRSPGLMAAADVEIRIDAYAGSARTITVSATPALGRDLAVLSW